jgi:hypothetical protein
VNTKLLLMVDGAFLNALIMNPTKLKKTGFCVGEAVRHYFDLRAHSLRQIDKVGELKFS